LGGYLALILLVLVAINFWRHNLFSKVYKLFFLSTIYLGIMTITGLTEFSALRGRIGHFYLLYFLISIFLAIRLLNNVFNFKLKIGNLNKIY